MLQVFSQLNIIIPKKEKKKLSIFFILNLLTIFLEMIGIAMVIPLMSAILSGDFIYQNQFTKSILEYFDNPSKEKILIFTMILIVIIFFIKNIVVGFFIWWQTNFAHKLQLLLSTKLYENYMLREYLFHTKINSSKLIRDTGNEPNTIRSAILELLTIFAEISLIIAIISFLIYYDPIANSIIIFTLFFVSLIFYLLTKNKVSKWGEIRLKMSGQTLKDLTQGFNGIKDIKILGKENFFINLYRQNLSRLVKMNILNGFIKSIPKLLLELLGIIIIFVLIVMLVFYDDASLEKILITLSLFVVCIFKILPSASRLLASLQAVRYRMASIELVSEEFKNFPRTLKNDNFENDEKIIDEKLPKILELNKVSFSYDDKLKGLKQISLKQKQDSILGILGPSGSGKSTLINLVLGLIKPDSGEILFSQKSIFKDVKSWQKNIGYIPQNIYLIDDTIKKNIALGIQEENINLETINDCIKMAELGKFISNLPDGIETKVGERGMRISGGELQRIGIARALYRKPKVLILDEATSALDIPTEKKILDTIYKLKNGKLIILISHRHSIYAYCSDILEINDGEGTIKENINDQNNS